MLVGNKSDDNDKREVNTSTGEALQVKIVEKLHFYFHLKNHVWLSVTKKKSSIKNVHKMSLPPVTFFQKT